MNELKDVNGKVLKPNMTVQFDDDYFGYGMLRTLYKNKKGILGFNSVPYDNESFCYASAWLKEIEVVTAETTIRTHGKRITVDGKRYFT